MNPGYDTEGWEAPYRYSDMNQAVSPGNLQKRPIPFLLLERKQVWMTLYRLCKDKIISERRMAEISATVNQEYSVFLPQCKSVS